MKFCDNIQKLRKEKHMSQEQLAEKLNVSRQAVSKWELGTAYPEMDKIIAMSKIFGCTLDELVNNEVKLNQAQPKKNLETYIDKVIKFFDDTLNYFSHLKFKDFLKFLVFLVFIFGIFILCCIPVNIIIKMGRDFLWQIPILGEFVGNVWEVVLQVSYIVICLAIFINIFQRKYLNKQEEQKDIKIITNETKTNIKTSKNISILDFLGKLGICFLKFIAIIIAIPFIISLLFVAILLAFSISLIFQKVFYLGVILSILGVLSLNIIILEILFNFIFNIKKPSKKTFISLISGVVVLGIGLGITSLDIANFKYIDKAPDNISQVVDTKEYPMQDNLLILNARQISYIEDNSLNDNIKIEISYYKDFSNYELNVSDGVVTIHKQPKASGQTIFNLIIADLRKKQIHNYNDLCLSEIKVITSKSNIEKLLANQEEYQAKERNSYLNELQTELNQKELEIKDWEEKYNEEVILNAEQKELYEEKINEYKEKIAEYKNSLDLLD